VIIYFSNLLSKAYYQYIVKKTLLLFGLSWSAKRYMDNVNQWHQWKYDAQKEFNRWAQTYDRSILNRLLFRRCYMKFFELILRNYPDRNQSLQLLDVGCGTGTFISMIAETDLEIHPFGLDMAEQMCKLGADKAKQLGLDKILHFITADSEHMPFEDASFDIVTCSNSFHHYPHQDLVLKEIYRVLKPDGLTIIIDGYVDNVIGWFVFDFCVAKAEGSVHHCRAAELKEKLESANYTDIYQEKFGFWVPVLATVAKKKLI